MSIHFASLLVLTGPKLRCRMIVVRTDDRSKNKTYILNVCYIIAFSRTPHCNNCIYVPNRAVRRLRLQFGSAFEVIGFSDIGCIQSFSQKSRIPSVAKLFQIGLCMSNPASHLACECASCLGATWRLTAVFEVLGTPLLRVSGDAPVAACGSAPGGLWRRRAMASCTCPERP